MHRRRALGVMTCLLWLLGVEVLPNLHLATHAGDHTHGDDGALVALWDAHERGTEAPHDESVPHAHGGDVHARDHASRQGDADAASLDQPGPPAHAPSGLAHHATALHEAPPALLAAVGITRTVWHLDAPLDDLIGTKTTARPTARGPPAV